MQSANTQPLLFQRLLSWLASKGRENRVPLLSAVVFGFLAHTFAFTNKLLNHDEANSLFSKGGTVALGRWGLGGLDSVFPNISMPWIYGVITILLLAVSVCILVNIFRLRNTWTQVLAAGFVLTFPSLTGTFGYMFTSSSYGVAFLAAVLTVWLLGQKRAWCWIAALGCMVFSLSIYQAYVSITASLLVLVLIRQLLEGEDALPVLRRGVAYVLFLVAALGGYFCATQIILRLKDVQMGDYASGSIVFSLRDLPANILLAYKAFLCFFRFSMLRLIPTAFSRRLHLALMGFAAVLLVLRLWGRKRSALSWALLAALILLFPLAINCMYLFTSQDSIHTLVLYSFVSVYLLVLVLADGCMAADARQRELLRALALNGVAVLSALIICVNIYIANASYLTLHLRYENAYAFYTSLFTDIKMSPEFTEGTKLAILGTWVDPDYYENELAFTNDLTGVTGFKPDSYSKAAFLRCYLGVSIPMASEKEQEKIAASAEYAGMPVYPYYGSMRKIGDVFVVKLS